jgi:3-oxoacyl-(acyl-carrier-protein) synthase
MIPVITGISRMKGVGAQDMVDEIEGLAMKMRFVSPVEYLAVAAAGRALRDAGISLPVGSAEIAIYIGIANAVEDIKDEYLRGVLKEGLLGVSPLLFPFTSPNALAAQVSIAYDIRGECITMPVRNSCSDVIDYATECISGKYAEAAVTGCLWLNTERLREEGERYSAEFYVMEQRSRAEGRDAKIYGLL